MTGLSKFAHLRVPMDYVVVVKPVTTFLPTVTAARLAMATRFEIALHGSNQPLLRAAAEEAFDEIDRWESLISIYRPTSDLARINARAAYEDVRVDRRVFRFLMESRQLSASTQGTFDMTAAPLFAAWGFIGGSGSVADPVRLQAARECVGWHHVHFDELQGSVRFDRPGVMLDPGAIGKGYALDRAVGCLHEAGVQSALIHGGTSTVFAIGHPPDAEGWTIALPTIPAAHKPGPIRTEMLRDQSLSVSAIWGKSFADNGLIRGHVIDPKTGNPVSRARMAMVIASTASESDALSTALLVLGPDGTSLLCNSFASIRCHVE